MTLLRPDHDGAASFLPGTLETAAAAVLLVDTATADVVYANDQARIMADEAPLPLPVTDWAARAGLDDVDPASLLSQDRPLTRVSGDRWVTAVPLGPVETLAGYMLLVFLRVLADGSAQDGVAAMSDVDLPGLDVAMQDAAEAGAVERRIAARTPDGLAALRHRAVLAMDVSFSIADAQAPGQPLMWVNPAFTRTTGYEFDEVVDRNCRFLQGEGTDRDDVRDIREALTAGRPITRTVLNYRRDGSAFWNEVAISPVRDGAGVLTNFVGVQADVTARVLLESQRATAYALEREARAAAERARAQTALIAEAGQAVTELDTGTAMARLLDLLVGEWAGWGAAYAVEEGLFRCVAVEGAAAPDVLRKHRFTRRRPPADLARAFAAQRTVVLDAVAPDGPYAGQGETPLVVAPLMIRDRAIGLLVLGGPDLEHDGTSLPDGTAEENREDFRALVDVVASRAALGLDIARLYRGQQELAEKLQRALLPQLPVVPGLELWGFYEPSSDGAKIGGDWYDVIPLSERRTLIAIGDVVGHDVEAATSMGRLRAVMQSYALEGLAPAELLGRLDAAIHRLHVPHLATSCVAVLDLLPDGSGTLTWSAAGHPPPLLRRAGGEVEVLTQAASPMLGAPGTLRNEASVPVGAGDTVLLYTDGLVEERGRLLSEGVADLAARLSRVPGRGAKELGEGLRPSRPDLIEDDAAMLLASVSVIDKT